MTVPVIAVFTNKGGGGKTALIYHLAWMYAELGWTVLAADLDPQAHLTSFFLDEDHLEELRRGGAERSTIYDAISPLMQGLGDIQAPTGLMQSRRLHLIAGSLELSRHEDDFSNAWLSCLEGTERAFRVTTAFWRVLQRAAEEISADLVLIDLSPHLGAINRAALIASDHIVVPIAPEPLSLLSLQTLGTMFRQWRDDWSARVATIAHTALPLPAGTMSPAGYVVLQHVLRIGQPLVVHHHSMERIPSMYAEALLGHDSAAPHPDSDPNCLGTVKRYGSLMALAQEARKPIFQLKASDGALGAHAKAALEARRNFEVLARRIATACGLRTGGNDGADEARPPAR